MTMRLDKATQIELDRLTAEDDRLDAILKGMLAKYERFFDCEFDDEFLEIRHKRGIVINQIHAIYVKNGLIKEKH